MVGPRRRLRRNQRGQGLVEYAIIIILIAAAVISVMMVVGKQTASGFCAANSGLGTKDASCLVWKNVTPGTSPPGRYGASMAYDAATSTVLMFGGASFFPTALNDTWSWDGTTWTQVGVSGANLGCNTTCPNSPSARRYAAMAYDAATQSVILFGGGYNDTWSWNGSTWTQVDASPANCTNNCTNSPGFRSFDAMAYDPVTATVLMFGGTTGAQASSQNDTWSWNGSAWAQIAGSPANCFNNCAGSPAARTYAAMTWDQATGTILQYGGYSSTSLPQNDTYNFNGTTTWTQAAATPPACVTTCTTGPPGRYQETLTYDPTTTTAILFGGNNGVASNVNDTWSWNGTAWTQVIGAPGCSTDCGSSPGTRALQTAVFDSATNQLVMFGGLTVSSVYADTWVLT